MAEKTLLEQAKEVVKHVEANFEALGRGDIAAAYREKGETSKAELQLLGSAAYKADIGAFRLMGGDEAAKHAEANLAALAKGDIAGAYREKAETQRATNHHIVEVAESLLVGPAKSPVNKEASSVGGPKPAK